MIQLLIKLGKFLETRFPKKLVLTEAEYKDLIDRTVKLDAEIGTVREDGKLNKQNLDAALDRLAKVEASAVHKGAVADLVQVVKQLKDEQVSFKASMGFNRTPSQDAELQAVLNGEPI